LSVFATLNAIAYHLTESHHKCGGGEGDHMAKKVRNTKSGSSDSPSKKQSKRDKLAHRSTSPRRKHQESTRNRPSEPPARVRRAQRKRKSSTSKQSLLTSHRIERAEGVIADLLGNPSLSFTAATRKREVDPRWVLKHLGSKFRKDSSGRIKVKAINRRYKTLYKPTATPGASIPVVTKNKRERRLLGKWMGALNAAGRNHWSKMTKFPKGQKVGGVLLETDPNEVQAILLALAEEESPYEGLYRTIARPS
jgi:hypothetical protein